MNIEQKMVPLAPTRIPVVFGRNRLRGKAEGAMVDDDLGEDNLSLLHQVAREEAAAASINVTAEWLNVVTSKILRMYEREHELWVGRNNDPIGYVLELVIQPTRRVILLGDRHTLAKFSYNP